MNGKEIWLIVHTAGDIEIFYELATGEPDYLKGRGREICMENQRIPSRGHFY